jgi:hypothetical protein
VNVRPSVAACLVVVLIVEMPMVASAQVARPAFAEEVTTPSTAVTVWPDLRPSLRALGGPVSLVRSESVPLALFAPAPGEIRLSSGAKTAIIVGAIIVGVLVIGGLLVLSRPGKHL